MGKPTVEEIATAIHDDGRHNVTWAVAHDAARAVLALLERKAAEPDDELWRAMRTVARATPSLYIPAELLELCRTPDEFIRHASRIAGLNDCQPDGKPAPAPVATPYLVDACASCVPSFGKHSRNCPWSR